MTPRILFVDHTAVLGGAEKFLLDITGSPLWSATAMLFEDGPFREALQAQGIPTVAVPGNERLSRIGRGSGAIGVIGALPVLRRLVRQTANEAHRHDVLYANSQKSMIVAALAGRSVGKPVIWHLHDILSTEHFGRAQIRAAVATSNRLVRRVVANSEATRDAYLQAGGDADRTVVVPNGFDPSAFLPRNEVQTAALRRSLDLEAGHPVVGVFSRLATWKGQHVLIEALRDLDDVQALVAGDALFRGDEEYKQQLQESVREYGLNGRVRFVGHRDDVPDLLQACDVVAHTSSAPEPFGRVIVEGMLSSVPVVATNAGGAREIITDGVDGLLVPPGDAAALRDALYRIASEPEWANKLARAGRETAEREYSLESVCDRIHRHVVDVLASDAKPRTAAA